MDGYIKSFDELPLIAKVILAIPALDIVWGLYKIFFCYQKKNMNMFILWIILYVLPTGFVLAVIDIITLITTGKVITLCEEN